MTGIWISTVIADVIDLEFGIKYHPGHVRKLLQDFGFSVQTPKRLLAAADTEKRSKCISATIQENKELIIDTLIR